MSKIHGLGGNKQQQQQTQQREPQQNHYQEERQDQFDQQDNLGGLGGWSGFGSGVLVNIPTNVGSERAYTFTEKCRSVIERLKQSVTPLRHIDISLTTLDNAINTELPYTVVAIVAINRASKVAVHYSVVIDTGDAKTRATERTFNREETVQIRPLPSLIAAHLDGDIQDGVLRHIGDPTLRVVSATGCVLPFQFNLEDDRKLDAFVTNAINACGIYLTVNDPHYQPFNIKQIPSHKSLVATSALMKNPRADSIFHDAAGLPFRTDIITRLHTPSTYDRTTGRESGGKLIASSAGYMEVIFDPSDGPRNEEYQYAAMFVATHLDTPELNTLNGILLAIYSSLNVFKDNYGIYSLAPDRHATEAQKSYQDIGVLNYEVEIEGESTRLVDLDSVNTPDQVVRAYLNAAFNPAIDYAIDVPELGASTWKLQPFVNAADGDSNAIEDILAAADELTDGNFSKYYKGGNPCQFISVLPQSTYEDDDGVLQDGRRLDYLMVYNLNEDNVQVVSDYSRYSLDTDIEESIRVHHLIRLEEALLSKCTVTGLHLRIGLSVEFLDALITAISDVGLSVNFHLPSNRSGRERYAPDRNRDYRRVSEMSSHLGSVRGGRDPRSDLRRRRR